MTQFTYTGVANAEILDASSLAAGDHAVLRGLGGDDTLIGSSGNDRFDGAAGADIMLGGAGDDMFFITLNATAGGPRDTIFGGSGTDTLVTAVNSSQLSTSVLQELARFDDFLSTTVPADPTAHFISDILHVDFAEGEVGLVRVDGVISTVHQVVHGPTAVADAYATQEDTPFTVDAAHGLLANDSLGAGALSAVAGTYATALGGSVAIAADGSFAYTPAADANGDDSFTYGVRDSLGRIATATTHIAVAAVEDAPVVTSAATHFVAENATSPAYQATATDVDAGTVLTWSLSGTDAARFDIDAVTGAVTFKVQPDHAAPTDVGGDNVYDIKVSASDGQLTTTKAVAITVTNADGTAIVTTAGTFYDANGDHIHQANETSQIFFAGAEKNVDLATSQWTIVFDTQHANVDITGFSADDTIVVKTSAIADPNWYLPYSKNVVSTWDSGTLVESQDIFHGPYTSDMSEWANYSTYSGYTGSESDDTEYRSNSGFQIESSSHVLQEFTGWQIPVATTQVRTMAHWTGSNAVLENPNFLTGDHFVIA